MRVIFREARLIGYVMPTATWSLLVWGGHLRFCLKDFAFMLNKRRKRR